jgi:ribosomal protein L24
VTFNNGDLVELTAGLYKGKVGTVSEAQAGLFPKGHYSFVYINGVDVRAVYNSDLRLMENEKDYESDF